MTRCKEFYDKVEREGFEWCEKDSATKSNINFYLKVVNELTEHGIEKKFTYVNFSENASRPLHKITDPKVRDEVISLIADALNRGEQPAQADVKVWIDLASGIDPVKVIEKQPLPEPPKPTPTPATVAAVAHVPAERVIQTYTPPRPIERTDPDDKANGAVKRDWNAGNDIPDKIEIALTRRTKAVMRQMVLYEKSLDHYQAIDFIIQEGVAKYEDICEIECLKESAEA